MLHGNKVSIIIGTMSAMLYFYQAVVQFLHRFASLQRDIIT